MEIKEFIEEKKKLEEELAESIAEILNRFIHQVGMAPSSISIYMIECTTLEDKSPQFLLGNVKTQFEVFSVR